MNKVCTKFPLSTTFSHVIHRVIKQMKAGLAGSLHEWTNKSLDETGHSTIILVISFIILFIIFMQGIYNWMQFLTVISEMLSSLS
jgi:hypothetical protein